MAAACRTGCRGAARFSATGRNIRDHSEADDPNALVDFLDAELLAGQHDGDVDFSCGAGKAAAGGNDDGSIMEGKSGCRASIRDGGNDDRVRTASRVQTLGDTCGDGALNKGIGSNLR